MKTIVFILTMAIVMAGKASQAASTYFGNALHENSIAFSATADHKFAAKMKLKIRNKKKRRMIVELEPGRVFYPESKTIQPFVVARPSIIALDPEEEKEVWVFARCGNSKAKAPNNENTFNRTEMGTPEMVASLRMMNQMHIESMEFYQRVIWFYTNQLHISAVHSGDTPEADEMRLISDLCRRHSLEIPWYKKSYKPAASGNDLEFSNIPEKLEAKIDVVLSKTTDLQIHLVDENGNVVRLLGVRNLQPSGVHSVPIAVDLQELTGTTYAVRITDGAGVLIETKSFLI
ncbi:MAG: hypothetical protein ACKORE_11695 [Bacteroidota bacterium]